MRSVKQDKEKLGDLMQDEGMGDFVRSMVSMTGDIEFVGRRQSEIDRENEVKKMIGVLNQDTAGIIKDPELDSDFGGTDAAQEVDFGDEAF